MLLKDLGVDLAPVRLRPLPSRERLILLGQPPKCLSRLLLSQFRVLREKLAFGPKGLLVVRIPQRKLFDAVLGDIAPERDSG